MKKSIALFLALVMIAAVLAGCGSSASDASTTVSAGTTESSAAADAQSKVLVVGASSDIITLDPADQMQANTSDLFDSIGSQLFTYDLDFNLVGDLCTEHTQVDDLTWDFVIREDAYFADGTQITAEDVQWTLTRVATDQSLVAYSNFNCIDHVDVVDTYTVRVVTKTARPDMLSLLAMPRATILPSAYIEANGMEAYTSAPVCSGPYLLKEWVPDDHYTLIPNPDYYGDDKATWEEVTYRIIPESSTRVSELLTGGVDIIDNVAVNEWERISSNTEGYGTSLAYGETSRVMLMILRMTDGWACSDPVVREAIEYAIDKDTICTALLQGAGTPTRTRIGSSVLGCNLDLFGSENANLYDPEYAKQLLADAGYQEGDLVLDMTASSGRYLMDAEMAQMIAAYLEAVGIKVNLELVDSTVLSQRFTDKENKDIFMIALSDGQYDGCYPLAQFCDPVRTTGMSDYNNPEIVELYEQTRVEMDQDAKVALSEQIQQIAADERPQIALCQMKAVFGISNRLQFNGRMDTCIKPDEVSLAG